MTPKELLEEWTSGEQSGMRPQRVQEVRNDLMEYTDLYFPRRISEIEPYVDRMKGEVTKRLKAATAKSDDESDSEDAQSDSSTDTEEEASDGEKSSEESESESQEDN